MNKNTQSQFAKHFIYNQHINKVVVPAAVAILLTFGRNEMLPFVNVYTFLDRSMNIFVLAAAFVVLPITFPRMLYLIVRSYPGVPILILWVSVIVLFSDYWPPRTTVITISISIALCLHISRMELQRLRLFVLLLSCIFSLYTLTYANDSLVVILSGSLQQQLGEFEPSNLIIFPRIINMLILTCVATVIIEERKWLKLLAVLAMIVPLLISLAIGNRGTMLALVVAIFAFVFGLSKNRHRLVATLIFCIVLIFSYYLVVTLLPVTEQRILLSGVDASSIERLLAWEQAMDINNISMFGQGVSDNYPHNIFLEFYLCYGIVGLILFLFVLATSVITGWKCYQKTHDKEVLWVLCLLVLQVVAQQFSLNIFYGTFWCAIVLPLGIGLNRVFDYPQLVKT